MNWLEQRTVSPTSVKPDGNDLGAETRDDVQN